MTSNGVCVMFKDVTMQGHNEEHIKRVLSKEGPPPIPVEVFTCFLVEVFLGWDHIPLVIATNTSCSSHLLVTHALHMVFHQTNWDMTLKDTTREGQK